MNIEGGWLPHLNPWSWYMKSNRTVQAWFCSCEGQYRACLSSTGFERCEAAAYYLGLMNCYSHKMCNKAHGKLQSMIVKPVPLVGEATQRFLAWGPKHLNSGSGMPNTEFTALSKCAPKPDDKTWGLMPQSYCYCRWRGDPFGAPSW